MWFKSNELHSQCFLFPRAIAESLAIQSGNTTSPEIPSEPNNSSSSNGVTLDDDLRLALQLSQQTLTEDEKRRQQEEEELERILKLSMQEKWPGGPKLRLSARAPPESATLTFFLWEICRSRCVCALAGVLWNRFMHCHLWEWFLSLSHRNVQIKGAFLC